MDDRRTEREEMVERQIRARGVRDGRVLAALRSVPRHEFLVDPASPDAYDDRPLPIGEEQTISQPYMVAAMTELLDLSPGLRVLEIGTGSGYQTAVLAGLAGRVFTVERISGLAARARRTLDRFGIANVESRVGDGTLGWPEQAPFDRILVTAAAPSIPGSLLGQLADPGRLVAPVGGRGFQDLVSIRRAAGRDEWIVHFTCTFVPLIGAEGYPEAEC